MCMQLCVPHEALEIFSSPVRYGILPSKYAVVTLMKAFSKQGDVYSKCVEEREFLRDIIVATPTHQILRRCMS